MSTTTNTANLLLANFDFVYYRCVLLYNKSVIIMVKVILGCKNLNCIWKRHSRSWHHLLIENIFLYYSLNPQRTTFYMDIKSSSNWNNVYYRVHGDDDRRINIYFYSSTNFKETLLWYFNLSSLGNIGQYDSNIKTK